jgi:hypothetical protein
MRIKDLPMPLMRAFIRLMVPVKTRLALFLSHKACIHAA